MIARRLLTVGFAIVAFIAVASIIALIPAWAILPRPYDALPDLPAKPAFIVFWIASVAAVIYAIRRFSSYRIAVSVGVIAYLALFYIYIFAMPAAEAYRGEKPFGYAVLNQLGGSTDHLVLFKTEGPLFYLNPPKPVARVRQKAGARRRDRKGRREMDDRPPSRYAQARHSNHGRAERSVLSVGGRRQLPKQSRAGPPRQLIQNNFFN